MITKQDVLEFFKENSKNCGECPFKKECDNTYSFNRMHTTTATNLCDAITMDDNSYEKLLRIEYL